MSAEIIHGLDNMVASIQKASGGKPLGKRKKIPELENLPKAAKEFLFNSSWQVLSLSKYYVSYDQFFNYKDYYESPIAVYNMGNYTPPPPEVTNNQ